MNLALWILQGLLAVHTLIGAVWKFTNTEQAVPSISALPHGAWLAMSVVEIALAIGLVIPALKPSLAPLAIVAALGVAAEMLLMSGLHLAGGASDHSPMYYWLVVAALCVFIALGRMLIAPI